MFSRKAVVSRKRLFHPFCQPSAPTADRVSKTADKAPNVSKTTARQTENGQNRTFWKILANETDEITFPFKEICVFLQKTKSDYS